MAISTKSKAQLDEHEQCRRNGEEGNESKQPEAPTGNASGPGRGVCVGSHFGGLHVGTLHEGGGQCIPVRMKLG